MPQPIYLGPHDAVTVNTVTGPVTVRRGEPAPDGIDPDTLGPDCWGSAPDKPAKGNKETAP